MPERDATPADPRKKILVVDDDPSALEMLQRYFGRASAKYLVQTAANGSDALMSVIGESPDLVLLDLSMPDMDGLSVLKQILGLDRSIAVIVVTGNADSAPAEALKLGAFAHFPKPIDAAYLDQLVPLALDRRRTPRLRFGESTSE
jgi:two-component system response regulator AlgR